MRSLSSLIAIARLGTLNVLTVLLTSSVNISHVHSRNKFLPPIICVQINKVKTSIPYEQSDSHRRRSVSNIHMDHEDQIFIIKDFCLVGNIEAVIDNTEPHVLPTNYGSAG